MNKENEIVTRRKKIMSFAAKWMKLESIMFNKKKKKKPDPERQILHVFTVGGM